MALTLCNSYTTTIWASIMFYSPETCGGDGGDYEMMGWWMIEPGSCALVYANDLETSFWYYFAHAADGAFWAGPFATSVPRQAFGGICWGVPKGGSGSSDFEEIGYRELDIGDNEDFTVTFVA
jgi:uncharacterized membrane protein